MLCCSICIHFTIINIMTSSISCKRFMEKINDDDDDDALEFSLYVPFVMWSALESLGDAFDHCAR